MLVAGGAGAAGDGAAGDCTRRPRLLPLRPSVRTLSSHPPCASFWLAQRPINEDLGGRADAQLSGLYEGENESRLWCGHCSALLSVTLRPALVHEGSDVLGYLDTINCRAVDCTVRKRRSWRNLGAT